MHVSEFEEESEGGFIIHHSVLVRELVDLLEVKEGGTYLDGTVGSGGDVEALLEKIGSSGIVLGIDRDKDAIERAGRRLSSWRGQIYLEHGNYADMKTIAGKRGIKEVDGVILDLGVSSEQLENSDRGFSFMKDGPLDMRMDCSDGENARDIVNKLPEDELAVILRDFGEERHARRIARFIVEQRKKMSIDTTLDLVRIVERAIGVRHDGRHAATRTFQAVRMAVNEELRCLKDGLEAGLGMLKSGGRMAVISFHSLEDRLVKSFFVRHSGRWVSLEQGGRRLDVEEPVVSLVNKKPVTASREEELLNPRSRSAKLRVVAKV